MIGLDIFMAFVLIPFFSVGPGKGGESTILTFTNPSASEVVAEVTFQGQEGGYFIPSATITINPHQAQSINVRDLLGTDVKGFANVQYKSREDVRVVTTVTHSDWGGYNLQTLSSTDGPCQRWMVPAVGEENFVAYYQAGRSDTSIGSVAYSDNGFLHHVRSYPFNRAGTLDLGVGTGYYEIDLGSPGYVVGFSKQGNVSLASPGVCV